MKETRSVKERIWDFLLDGLWLDGLRVFFVYARVWWKVALGFAVAALAAHYLETQLPSPWLTIALEMPLYVAKIYFFTFCFLREEPVGGKAPLLAVKSFGFIFAYLLSMTFIAALAVLLAHSASVGIFAARAALALTIFLYLVARLLPLGPLLLNGAPSPLKTSLTLTRGKAGRLAANTVMLTVMMIPPFILIKLAGLGFLAPAFGVIANGIHAAFTCAAYRVLYGEDVAARLGYDRRAARRD
ncbi:MAG: hypothetical protein P4M15_08350 [Alphaproteobacteria bacterium]|nr:hypothetical protein [Alphaproteobacteria bacterium]